MFVACAPQISFFVNSFLQHIILVAVSFWGSCFATVQVKHIHIHIDTQKEYIYILQSTSLFRDFLGGGVGKSRWWVF